MPLTLPRRTLTPLIQPDGSDLCAPASIAMVAGCTLEDAVFACRSRWSGGCNNAELKRGLRNLGVKFGRLIQYSASRWTVIPDFCIAGIRDRTKWAHAVAILDGFVYDPGLGWPLPLHIYEHWVIEGRYSRIYSPLAARKLQRRNQRAHWDVFLPILSEPPCSSTSSTSRPVSSPPSTPGPAAASA